MKKCDRIVATVQKMQARYFKRHHKFDVELPKPVDQALTMDAENGNTIWADAIQKKMENIRAAFKILPDETRMTLITSLCDVLWYSTSKWKASDRGLGTRDHCFCQCCV